MRKTQKRHNHRRYKKRKTIVKGGDCGCGKMKWSGGYGAASFQGGLTNYTIPVNTNTGGDPIDPANVMSERHVPFSFGGKRKHRHTMSKKMKGGISLLPNDIALGGVGRANPMISFGTTGGMVNASSTLTGKTF